MDRLHSAPVYQIREIAGYISLLSSLVHYRSAHDCERNNCPALCHVLDDLATRLSRLAREMEQPMAGEAADANVKALSCEAPAVIDGATTGNRFRPPQPASCIPPRRKE